MAEENGKQVVLYKREMPRRFSDKVMWHVVTASISFLVAILLSYVAWWNAYQRDAVSRKEVLEMVGLQNAPLVEKVNDLKEGNKAIFDKIDSINKELVSIRVETGIEYGTAQRPLHSLRHESPSSMGTEAK